MQYAFKYSYQMLSTLTGIIYISKNHYKQACKQYNIMCLEWNGLEIRTVSFMVFFT